MKARKKRYAPYSGFKTQSFVINIPQTSERMHILSWSKKKEGGGAGWDREKNGFKMYHPHNGLITG